MQPVSEVAENRKGDLCYERSSRIVAHVVEEVQARQVAGIREQLPQG